MSGRTISFIAEPMTSRRSRLNILDEFGRECLAIHVKRKLNSQDVLHVLGKLFLHHGPPQHTRSDKGSEFVARAVLDWLARMDVKTLFIKPGSLWENDYVESFNARMRAELLAGEILESLTEAQIVIESWRQHYNTKRSHSALGHRPPAAETLIPVATRPVMH